MFCDRFLHACLKYVKQRNRLINAESFGMRLLSRVFAHQFAIESLQEDPLRNKQNEGSL